MNGPDRLFSRPVSRRSLVLPAIAAPLLWLEHGRAQVASPEASPAPAWTIEDLEAAGLTGSNSYRSPLYGYEVEWPESWQLATDTGMQPVRSTTSWGDPGRDDLFLVPVDPEVIARLAFSGRPDDGRTVGDMMDTPLPVNGGVRLLIRERRTQVTWVDLAFAEGTATPERLEVNQVIALNGGALLFIWLLAEPESSEVSFTTAQEILLHGDPLFTTVEWQDIADGLARWP